MICEWFLEKMPWCVEHIGGAPLAVQIALAFALLAAMVLGHYGIQAAVCRTRPRRRTPRFNWLARWLAQFSDDEPFIEDWMDAEAWHES